MKRLIKSATTSSKPTITFLGIAPNAGIVSAKTRFCLYSFVQRDGYEMGIEVLDDLAPTVMITLFHWDEHSKESQKQRLTYFPTDGEKNFFVKVYTTSKGRFFIFDGVRVYLPPVS